MPADSQSDASQEPLRASGRQDSDPQRDRWVSRGHKQRGEAINVVTPILCFAGGLILVGAGIVSEISKLGGIRHTSLGLMKAGVVAFFAGLIQNILALAHVPDLIAQTPSMRSRLSQGIVVESWVCVALGMILMALGCALYSANIIVRVGGVMSGLGALGGLGAMLYEFLSASGDPFSLLAYFLLSASCCGVGLLIVLLGLKKDGSRLRRTTVTQA